MQLSTFDKANRSQQNLPQGKQTSSMLVNNTHDLEGFALFIDRLHNALDGRFEKWRDVGTKKKRYSTS